ncbi:Fe-S cluster assembly sulfur transfer protein SufU [Dubosiella newyorkensis]|uniref:Fe-S cluster assembly sulfur transfer protein SufU n=1 Tax=Dubosiella newyorkensis TaxID=1862672 RepID=UPI00248B62EB|nr:SUF system NifU family Fe-S cluster assembly protein [Dubosiella newyorkensis]
MANIDGTILRDIIMDHYQYPRNKTLVENDDSYKSKHMASDSCIDDITVQAKVKDGKIEDVRFDGVACAISTASTDIMGELLKGKTILEAQEIIDNYMAMVDEEAYDEELLDEAIAFQNVGKQANRIKCATIGWNGIQEILNDTNKGEEDGQQ